MNRTMLMLEMAIVGLFVVDLVIIVMLGIKLKEAASSERLPLGHSCNSFHHTNDPLAHPGSRLVRLSAVLRHRLPQRRQPEAHFIEASCQKYCPFRHGDAGTGVWHGPAMVELAGRGYRMTGLRPEPAVG